MSKFILKSETAVEELDWGSLAWISHPPTTKNKQLTVIDVNILPNKGHDFHCHPHQEETIVVVEGQIEQWIEKEKKILNPGDSVHISPNIVHASFNVGKNTAKLLVILGPCVGDIGYELTDVSDQAPWNTINS